MNGDKHDNGDIGCFRSNKCCTNIASTNTEYYLVIPDLDDRVNADGDVGRWGRWRRGGGIV